MILFKTEFEQKAILDTLRELADKCMVEVNHLKMEHKESEKRLYRRIGFLEKELEQVKDGLKMIHERFIRMRGRFALLTTLHRGELAQMGLDADGWLKEMKGKSSQVT